MAYAINLGISDVSADRQSLKLHGQKVTYKYFDEIIITPMLNSMTPADSVGVLKQIHDAGLPVRLYGTHVVALTDYIQEKAERDRKAAIDAAIDAERIASANKTQAEIKAENEQREANRQAEINRARGVRSGGGYF